MIAFLRWAKSIALSTLNGIVKFTLLIVILIGVLMVIGLFTGDGLAGKMVLSLDLRAPLKDSTPVAALAFGPAQVSVMDIVLGLETAGHDSRVKGVILRVGGADLSVAQAEEIGAALKRFRQSGRFVIADSQGFEASGLGDYLTAAAADEIWMQPKSPFTTAGEGGGEVFLRGLFDKIHAEPQIAKRAEYKSAADMYMEKDMTAPDREQLTRLMQSWYDAAASGVAADRKITREAAIAAFEASPQFTEDAQKAGLVDRIGYDDDALAEAVKRAGGGAKSVTMGDYIRAKGNIAQLGEGPRIALIEASGDIVEGTAGTPIFDGSAGIAGDDLARAIRQATKDNDVKAILLRVDSPGGSVTASDQILDAVRKARARGKPVVVSMGGVAASGGYYISCFANKIVAEPGTLTGSIGVLTGKVSLGKSLAMAGVGTDQVGVGKNALIDSSFTPYTPAQWADVNAEADAIYADFTQKVATGRKLPLEKVQQIAKGRVWTGADAITRGLVDELGGFWSAVADSKKLAGIAPDTQVSFMRYPRQKGFFAAVGEALGDSDAAMGTLHSLSSLLSTPAVRVLTGAIHDMPREGIELRAGNLPR